MEKRKRATRGDVAREAGVTETIVSYVLNGNRYVQKEKKERVQEAVKKLCYQPNQVARILKGKASRQIIFIADQISSGYFGQLVSEMTRYAYEQEYLISLCESQDTPEFVSQIISRQFDGIIISSSIFKQEYIEQFAKAGIPLVVFLNRQYQDLPAGISTIDTGLYEGSRECVRFLKDKGRTHLLYLDRIGEKQSSAEDMRLHGFCDQVKESGLELDSKRILTGCLNEEALEQAIWQCIKDGMKVDGIVARYDILAAVAITALRKIGVEVPKEVAVIGFDNAVISQYTNPTITTMEMQKKEISKETIEILFQMIEGKCSQKAAAFRTKLIERETTN